MNLWQFFADRLFEFFAVLFFYFDVNYAAKFCILLLYLLMVLQLYWFGLILKVAVKLMRGQGAEDIRSDDEDEAPKSPGQSKDREKQPYSRTPEGTDAEQHEHDAEGSALVQDECFLAYSIPYTYTDLLRDLQPWPWESLATTMTGNQVPVLRLGNEQSLQRACIVARAHPGETHASWVMRGVLDFLASDEARGCLSQLAWLIVPMLNVDGVAAGRTRTNLDSVDLNRHHHDDAAPETKGLRSALQAESRKGELLARRGVFAIANGNDADRLVTPLLDVAGTNRTETRPQDVGVGRVAAASQGYKYSLTIESSLCARHVEVGGEHLIWSVLDARFALPLQTFCARMKCQSRSFAPKVMMTLMKMRMQSMKVSSHLTDHPGRNNSSDCFHLAPAGCADSAAGTASAAMAPADVCTYVNKVANEVRGRLADGKVPSPGQLSNYVTKATTMTGGGMRSSGCVKYLCFTNVVGEMQKLVTDAPRHIQDRETGAAAEAPTPTKGKGAPAASAPAVAAPSKGTAAKGAATGKGWGGKAEPERPAAPPAPAPSVALTRHAGAAPSSSSTAPKSEPRRFAADDYEAAEEADLEGEMHIFQEEREEKTVRSQGSLTKGQAPKAKGQDDNEVSKAVRKAAVEIHLADIPTYDWLHDGNNMLYIRKTVTKVSDCRTEVEVPGKTSRSKPFRVAIEVKREDREIDLSALHKPPVDFKDASEAMGAMSEHRRFVQVAIRTLALEREALIAQGRKVVCPDARLVCDAIPLRYGREMWFGYIGQLEVVNGGLLPNGRFAPARTALSLNLVASVGIPEQTFIQLLGRLRATRLKEIMDLTRNYWERDYSNMRNAMQSDLGLKKLKVTVEYGTVKIKGKRIFGTTDRPANKVTFDCEEMGGKTNVVDYFMHKHNVRVKYPNLPCIQLGTAHNCIPFEFVHVLGGEHNLEVGKLKAEFQQEAIVDATCS
eukprot:g10392.t1